MTLANRLLSNTHKTIPAFGDGTTLETLNETELPALYLSATLATETLLAEHDQGLLALSEYSKLLRDIRLKTDQPLIGDLQSGFGNPLNTYYAAQELERSGADILILNDQNYPAHSKERPQTTTIEDLYGKTKAALDAFEDEETELWIQLDGIWKYGTEGSIERISKLSRLNIQGFILNNWDADQMMELTKQGFSLPLIATWQPEDDDYEGLIGWLDQGYLQEVAKEAQQIAMQRLVKGEMTNAQER